MLGSGSVNPGDDFNWTFTDCWANDTTDDFDDLVRGQVGLRNWIENVDSGNRLVSAGFAAFSGPGGLHFADFELGETVEAPPESSPSLPPRGGGHPLFSSSPGRSGRIVGKGQQIHRQFSLERPGDAVRAEHPPVHDGIADLGLWLDVLEPVDQPDTG